MSKPLQSCKFKPIGSITVAISVPPLAETEAFGYLDQQLKIPNTYRLLSAVVALTLLIGIALPAGLHAHMQISEICPPGMDHDHSEGSITVEQCMMHTPVQSSDSSGHDHASTMDGNCELVKACSCSLHNSQVKQEAIPVPVKAKVILPVSALDSGTDYHSVSKILTASRPNSHSSPPPIFLLNGSFLN